MWWDVTCMTSYPSLTLFCLLTNDWLLYRDIVPKRLITRDQGKLPNKSLQETKYGSNPLAGEKINPANAYFVSRKSSADEH